MFVKRKPGQHGLLITTPAREVNHVDVANRVCSFDLSIRTAVFQAGFPVCPSLAHRRHTCHRQTHRDRSAACDGLGSAGGFPNLSSGIEPRHLVHAGRQSHVVGPAGARRSPCAASIAIRSVLRTAILSRSAACAGCACCCWFPFRGRHGYGRCRFSRPCAHPGAITSNRASGTRP